MSGRMRQAWFIGALLVAALAYFYALGSSGIPSNGDEFAYAHIARRTAESGHWLPLGSDMPNLRNTKPPLLFWQGIVSTDWGRVWTLWRLRLPSVLYTLASAAVAMAVVRRLTQSWERGAKSAIIYLGCYAVFRYGRPFLTDPPEVFWLSLPLAALLWTRGALLESRLLAPLAIGIVVGIAALYKSFAVILPVALVMCGWFLQRRRSLRAAVTAAAPAVAIVALVALAVFAIWPLLDPQPGAIWREFVLGENAGKLDTARGYLRTLLWGGFSLPAFIGALFVNGGLLAPILVALAIDGWRHRRDLSAEERWLWIWVLGFLVAFALPSQRSGRYLLPVMPALAMLTALAWPRLPRLAFMASAALAVLVGVLFAYVSVLIVRDAQLRLELPWGHWAVLTVALGLAATALTVPRLAPATAPVSVLLLLLLMGIALRTFDAPPGPYSGAVRARLRGEAVYVPCNFSASEEGVRFLLPGADVRSYAEDDRLTPAALAPRYRFFAAYVPLGAAADCEGCRLLGERYVVRGRRAATLAEDLEGSSALQGLFAREVLFESSRAPPLLPPAPEACAREARHAP
jgi:4-amino-4-deoxy-L-arabinose transferase-like glycosyltransferase